jgi:hypothetical protein
LHRRDGEDFVSGEGDFVANDGLASDFATDFVDVADRSNRHRKDFVDAHGEENRNYLAYVPDLDRGVGRMSGNEIVFEVEGSENRVCDLGSQGSGDTKAVVAVVVVVVD